MRSSRISRGQSTAPRKARLPAACFLSGTLSSGLGRRARRTGYRARAAGGSAIDDPPPRVELQRAVGLFVALDRLAQGDGQPLGGPGIERDALVDLQPSAVGAGRPDRPAEVEVDFLGGPPDADRG